MKRRKSDIEVLGNSQTMLIDFFFCLLVCLFLKFAYWFSLILSYSGLPACTLTLTVFQHLNIH